MPLILEMAASISCNCAIIHAGLFIVENPLVIVKYKWLYNGKTNH